MDGGGIRRVRVLHIDQRSATEVHTQRDAMPERHGKHSGNAEDQREGQEVPLFPEEIDVCVSKKFHAAYDPFKNRFWEGHGFSRATLSHNRGCPILTSRLLRR